MKKILLIDDEQAFLDGIATLLDLEGFKIESTSDPRKGFEMIKNETYDVIITDILMPEKDGIEIITHLLKQKTRPKIIAISGGGRIDATDYLDVAKKFGVEEAIAKPFSKDELVEKINQVTNS